MTIPHIMVVQAVYTDKELSARRLGITSHTLAPALQSQIRKPTIHLTQHPEDPHRHERTALLLATGCEVVEIYRDEWKLYGEDYQIPSERCVVSRCDDDDSISKDFCSRTYEAAEACTDPCALIWPIGYVFWRSNVFLLSHPGNQFVSLLTDTSESPHDIPHWKYSEHKPIVTVSRDPGWLWVRHGDSHTSTLQKYRKRKLRGIAADRFGVNLRAVIRAIKGSGIASANYEEHGERNAQESV
jgi:hypothetical protein